MDTVTAKLEIIMRAKEAGVPVISCMGAGNKLDPTQFHVADIYKTTMCPLAKVMRRELKKRGVKKLKVVYSTESPVKPLENMENSCKTVRSPLPDLPTLFPHSVPVRIRQDRCTTVQESMQVPEFL